MRRKLAIPVIIYAGLLEEEDMESSIHKTVGGGRDQGKFTGKKTQIKHITKQFLEVAAVKALIIEAWLDSMAAADCSLLYLHPTNLTLLVLLTNGSAPWCFTCYEPPKMS